MKIVAISGSLNPHSTTYLLVSIVAQAAQKAGAKVEIFDFRQFPLPFYDTRADEATYPENVHLFRRRILQADGLIIGSPEYHGSVSGVLKNALDFIGSRQFEGKAVALVGTSGGSLGATHTLNTLNIICQKLHAWPLPFMLSVPQSYSAFDSEGRLKDIKLQRRFEELGGKLVRTVELFKL